MPRSSTRWDPSALAGVGLAATCLVLIAIFGTAALESVRILVGRALAASHREGASPDDPASQREAIRAVVTTGAIAAMLVGAAMTVLGQALAEPIAALAPGDDAGREAIAYLRVALLGVPAMLVFVALQQYRYALGDSRTPMIAAALAHVSNIALDYAFIYVFHWGVAGAAGASCIAHVLAVAVMVPSARTNAAIGLRAGSWAIARRMWRLGIPIGLEATFEYAAIVAMVVVIGYAGETHLASHHAAFQVTQFAFLPAVAVGQATATFTTQAAVAGRDDLVMLMVGRAAQIVAVFMLACAVALATLADVISLAFSTDADVRRGVIDVLRIAALFQLFDGLSLMLKWVLRSVGDTWFAAVTGALLAWSMLPSFAWILRRGPWAGRRGSVAGIPGRDRARHGDPRLAVRERRLEACRPEAVAMTPAMRRDAPR